MTRNILDDLRGGRPGRQGGAGARRPIGRWACLIGLTGGLAVISAQGAAARDVRSVKARYVVSVAGVRIGDFDFNSQIDGQRYTIDSATSIKLLFGTFKWSSRSVTKGVVRGAIMPEAFEFNYRSNSKRFRTAVRFARGDVAALENHPPVRPSRKRVPLRPEHLKDVMDPMSAIMAMTRGAGRNPCQGSFDVFEGRVRFKLSLEAKGKRRIPERGNSGQPRVGHVCRIRFIPIAGHKRNKTVQKLSRNSDMEVVLRPVPIADLFVPYLITVPTGYGTVSIASQRVEIIGGRRERIALNY